MPRLSAHGLAALHGSSPDVGIAGYSLGGGIGWLSRRHGMQANAVTALELVTGEGELLRADHVQHPELFWALRGGGGSFGVVTAIEFGVLPLDELHAGALFFPFERASEVLHAWSALLPDLPDEMMSWASLLHFPPIPDVPAFARGRSLAVVMAAFLGSEAEGRALLHPLRDLGPERDTLATVPPVVLADLAMDPLDPLPFHMRHQLLEALPPRSIDAIVGSVGLGSGRGDTLTMLQFRHMGGALGRATPGAGARATLPGEVLMMSLGVVLEEDAYPAVRAVVDEVEVAVRPRRVGHYPNFVETPADASGFFDAETWARLRAVKTRYDADDLFAGNHHIPPVDRRSATLTKGERHARNNAPSRSSTRSSRGSTTGNLDALMSLYETKAAFAAQPGSLAHGGPGIREALAGFIAMKGALDLEVTRVLEVDDLALVTGVWSFNGTGPDGEPVRLSASNADVLRRQADGSWRFVIDNPWGTA